ncbi:MAG: YqaE/Pmp3 family membrane protein [Lacibacter sp.]
MKEWNSLSAKQKRERYKAVKQEIKKYKKEKRKNGAADTDTLLLVILAILLPPLAIYLHQGEINNKFWIGLILTLLGWLPGIIYALIVILGNG